MFSEQLFNFLFLFILMLSRATMAQWLSNEIPYRPRLVMVKVSMVDHFEWILLRMLTNTLKTAQKIIESNY